MLHPNLSVTLAVLASLPVAVRAQSVLHVGPGAFQTVQLAVTAAQSGDVIRIAPGIYLDGMRFSSKSLTLIADAPGVSIVSGVGLGGVSVGLRPQDRLHCQGIGFFGAGLGSVFVFSGGVKVLENCSFGAQGVSGATFSAGQLHLRHCASQLTFGLVDAIDTTASDCTLAGGSGTTADALVATGGSLFLSNCQLTGFSPTIGAGGRGLWASGASVWLVDCTVTGGASPSVPGAAIETDVPVRLHRCTTTGGLGPTGTAPAIVGTAVPGPLLGLSTGSDVALGTAWPMTLAGEAGDVLLLAASLGITAPFPVAGLEQPAFGFVGAVTLGVFVADAQGRATTSLFVPANPALRHIELFVRGVDLARFPLQASAVAGIVIP